MKYMKLLFALVTAALLGSSAWAATASFEGSLDLCVGDVYNYYENHGSEYTLSLASNSDSSVADGVVGAEKMTSGKFYTITAKKAGDTKIVFNFVKSGTTYTGTFNVHVSDKRVIAPNGTATVTCWGNDNEPGAASWSSTVEPNGLVTVTPRGASTAGAKATFAAGSSENSGTVTFYNKTSDPSGSEYVFDVTVSSGGGGGGSTTTFRGQTITYTGTADVSGDGTTTRVLTFKSGSGTIVVPNDATADIFVVGGGGSGAGGRYSSGAQYGNGGNGGQVFNSSDQTLTGEVEYKITVGAGGDASGADAVGNAGKDSSFSGTGVSVTATGGAQQSTKRQSSPSAGSAGSGATGNYGKAGAAAAEYARNTEYTPSAGDPNTGSGGQGGGVTYPRGGSRAATGGGAGGSGVVIVTLKAIMEPEPKSVAVQEDLTFTETVSSGYYYKLVAGSDTLNYVTPSPTTATKATGTTTGTLKLTGKALTTTPVTVRLQQCSTASGTYKTVKAYSVTVTPKPQEISYRGRTIKYLGAAAPTIVNEGTVNETITFSFETVGDGMLGLPADVIADYLVVGGGGGGGGSYYASQSKNRKYGKGGNGGNKIEKANKQKLVGGTYAVKVGKGGDGGAAGNGATAQGGNGDLSSFNGDSANGGAGGTYNQTSATTGNNGDGYTTASVLTGKNYGKGGAAAGNSAPTAVDANTGNGGGAGSASSNTANNQKGGAGGSGVVVVKIYGFIETPAQDGEIVGSPVLIYGQTLAAITTFTGSMKDSQGNEVTGTFAFNSKTTKPTVAQSGSTFKATFTPDSSMPWYQANNSVDVVVMVEKATPTVTAWPTASDIQQTQSLGDSTLTGGSATPAGGTFAWVDPEYKPSMGDGQKFDAIYTPTDLANYTVAMGEITINVKRPPKEPIDVTDATSSSQVNGKNIPDEDNYPRVKMNGEAYTFDVDTVNSMIEVEDASGFHVAANYELTAAELSKFTLNGVNGADVATALLGQDGTFSGGTFSLSGSGISLAGGTFTYADDMMLAVPGGLVLADDVVFFVPANKTLVVSDELTISGSGKMILAGDGLVEFLGDKLSVEAQGWAGTVDGEEHAPKVTATLTKFAPDQTPDRSVLVEYSTDGATWSITAPAFDEVGTHPVSYRVTVGGIEKETGSVDVIINPMQDQTISLSLLQNEKKTIDVVGAVPGESWKVTVPAQSQSYVSVSPLEGSGKTFHVTFTAGANKTTSPVTVTIACDSVTYTYKISVIGAYEENKVNLAYGGEGFGDEVTMYYWYQNSSTSFKPRHFQTTTNTSNNTTYKNTDRSEAAIAACNAILDINLRDTTARACIGTRMAAKAPAGSTYIAVWRSSDKVTGLTMGGTPGQNGNYPVVLKPKRVVYVGKTVEAYCYSSVGTSGSGQYTSQAWTGNSADASIATVTASGSAGASFKPVFTGVGVGRTYAIVEDVKETKNATLSGTWPDDTPAEDKVSTANVTNGASYKLWVEVRDIPALQPGTLAASSIVYGQTLADSVITPGTMKDSKGNEIKGTFAWADLTIAPKVSDSETTPYDVIFTPDNEFYDTVPLKVTVKVYAPLTVTANDKEITRGHDISDVSFDVEYDGFVGGDTPASLGGKLAFTCAYDKQTALAGEKYAITPKGLTSDKYAITFVDGNLTVVAPVLTEKILTDVDRSSGVNEKKLSDEEFLPVVVLENAPYYFDTDATNVAVEVRGASTFETQDPYVLTYGQIARFTLNGLFGANFGAAFLSEGTTFTGSFSTKTAEVDVVTFNGGTFTCPNDAMVAFAGEIALADDLEFDVADGKVVTIGADNVLSGEGKIVNIGEGLIDFAGDGVVVSAAGWKGIVDGETHSPSVGVKFTPFAEANTFERTATVEYSTDEGDSWVTEVPAISAIGEHAIQYRVVVAGVVKESGNCDISISKMDDVEDTLKLGTDEEDMITCTGAFETDEWTVTTDTEEYEDYFEFDKTEGTGKTFQVILTTKGELTVKPIWVTIACGSVTYKYKVTVGAAGEEGAINLAYGGSDAADVVKISENNTTSGTPNRRYFKAALTGEGVSINSTAAERGYYKEWTLTATASNKEAQVSIQVSSGDSDSNYSQTHADKIVTMGKRVAYVGKKLTAYCWSAYNNEWTFTSADPTIATVSGDTAQSTEAYVSITGVKPGKTSITVSNVKKSTSGNATQTGYEYTLWVEVREQPVLDGTLTTTEITEGDALSASTISGKMVNSKGEQVYGKFAWDDNTIIPTLADSEKTQYVVTFKPTAGSGDYYDQVKLVATVKVNQKITYIDVPAAQGPFTYDGVVKIGVAGGDGYTLEGDVSATDAGDYTAIAKLVDGYAWKDDKTGDQEIKWSIAQRAITVTACNTNMLVGCETPELKYEVTSGELAEGDELTGTLTVKDELTVGNHDIVQADDWDNPNYDITFEKGTLTVKAGKMTVNGKGYDNITDAFLELLTSKGVATFNDTGIVYDGMTFRQGATLIVANDESWTVTGDSGTSLIATKIPAKMDLTVNGTLELAGDIFVAPAGEADTIVVVTDFLLDADITIGKESDGATDAMAHLIFDTFTNEDNKHWMTLTTNGVVQSKEKLVIADVFTAALAGYVITETSIGGGYFEYKLEALTVIDVPTAVTGLIYNGNEQTGVVKKVGFTLTGNVATNAGNYTAIAKLEDGYAWKDGKTDDQEIKWSISSAKLRIGGVEIDPANLPTPPSSDDTDASVTGVGNVIKAHDGKATNVNVVVTTPASGATVKFSVDKTTWTEAASFEGFTDVGTNKVWYAVEAVNYLAVTNYAWVTINEKEKASPDWPAIVEPSFVPTTPEEIAQVEKEALEKVDIEIEDSEAKAAGQKDVVKKVAKYNDEITPMVVVSVEINTNADNYVGVNEAVQGVSSNLEDVVEAGGTGQKARIAKADLTKGLYYYVMVKDDQGNETSGEPVLAKGEDYLEIPFPEVKPDSVGAYFKVMQCMTKDEEEGPISKTIGLLRKPAYKSAPAREFVGAPWGSLKDAGDIAVENFLVTKNLAEGTKLYSYVRDDNFYNAWELDANKVWQPIKTFKMVNGQLSAQEADTAADAKIARGTGAWVEREAADKKLTLIGEASEEAVKVPETEGYNILSAKNFEALDLSTLTEGAQAGKDSIIIPQSSGVPLVCTFKDGAWGYDGFEVTTKKVAGQTVEVRKAKRITDIQVPAGAAFWYVRGEASK